MTPLLELADMTETTCLQSERKTGSQFLPNRVYRADRPASHRSTYSLQPQLHRKGEKISCSNPTPFTAIL